MKVSELRGLSVEELQEKVRNWKRDLMQLRFQAKTGKLERQSAIKELRRDVARALTLVGEKKGTEKL
ncbi:MAG: 50S ribosomal protein L29 [Candidatus Omnitrophica bacterium]|nr:50S ribosomal protein L29 [Candidatus Omnitrophota bacterium]